MASSFDDSSFPDLWYGGEAPSPDGGNFEPSFGSGQPTTPPATQRLDALHKQARNLEANIRSNLLLRLPVDSMRTDLANIYGQLQRMQGQVPPTTRQPKPAAADLLQRYLTPPKPLPVIHSQQDVLRLLGLDRPEPAPFVPPPPTGQHGSAGIPPGFTPKEWAYQLLMTHLGDPSRDPSGDFVTAYGSVLPPQLEDQQKFMKGVERARNPIYRDALGLAVPGAALRTAFLGALGIGTNTLDKPEALKHLGEIAGPLSYLLPGYGQMQAVGDLGGFASEAGTEGLGPAVSNALHGANPLEGKDPYDFTSRTLGDLMLLHGLHGGLKNVFSGGRPNGAGNVGGPVPSGHAAFGNSGGGNGGFLPPTEPNIGHSQTGDQGWVDYVRGVETPRRSGQVATTGPSLFTASELGLPKIPPARSFAADTAYANARQAFPLFEKLLHDAVGPSLGSRGVTLDGSVATMHKLTSLVNEPGAFTVVAPIKGESRASEKVRRDYGGDWSRLTDLVRGSIVVDRLSDIPNTLNLLRDAMKPRGFTFSVLPVDKFSRPSSSGYRDVQLMLTAPNGQICELQVHVKPMFRAKNDSHALYEQIRDTFGRAFDSNRSLSQVERQGLRPIQERQRSMFEDAWQTILRNH